jgi:hypothetical protein
LPSHIEIESWVFITSKEYELLLCRRVADVGLANPHDHHHVILQVPAVPGLFYIANAT